MRLWFWKKRSEPPKADVPHPPAMEVEPEPAASTEPLLGSRDQKCPYCSIALSTMPGAKKRCPICGRPIYVRTDPFARVKVLLRDDELPISDGRREIARGMDALSSHAAPIMDSIRSKLHEKLGRAPAERDVRWSYLNKRLMQHARRQDWGLYCNIRFLMAHHRLAEADSEGALRTYLEVCYLDMNNPSNMGGATDPDLIRDFPPFDPRPDWLGPALVDWVAKVARHLCLSEEDLHSRFMKMAFQIQKAMKLPLAPEEAWSALQNGLVESEARRSQKVQD